MDWCLGMTSPDVLCGSCHDLHISSETPACVIRLYVEGFFFCLFAFVSKLQSLAVRISKHIPVNNTVPQLV